MMPDEVRGDFLPDRPGRELPDSVGDSYPVVPMTRVLEQEGRSLELTSDRVVKGSR